MTGEEDDAALSASPLLSVALGEESPGAARGDIRTQQGAGAGDGESAALGSCEGVTKAKMQEPEALRGKVRPAARACSRARRRVTLGGFCKAGRGGGSRRRGDGSEKVTYVQISHFL